MYNDIPFVVPVASTNKLEDTCLSKTGRGGKGLVTAVSLPFY